MMIGLDVLSLGVLGLSRSEDFLVVPELDLVEFEAFEVELSFLSCFVAEIVGVVFVEFEDFAVELSFFSWASLRIVGVVLVE